MIWNKISWPIFFISFAIGLFLVYVFGEDIKKVYVYPTPDNVDNILFKDKTGNCVKYSMEETSCPIFGVNPIPIAE
jgi:hypothetical protein